MDKDFKQGFVDSIIALRGFALDEEITKILQDLVSQEIPDQVFIAKVYTELNVHDTVGANMSNDLISFQEPYGQVDRRRSSRTPLNTFNKALNNSVSQLYGVSDWKTAQTDEDKKRNQDIYAGLDIAAGIKGPEGSENAKNYYDYLNTKLEKIVEETGTLGVIVRPPRGEGGQIYVTEDLNEWFINNPPRDMTEGFYPTEGKDYRKYPGFAKPTILTKPVMTFNDESGYYEHTGDYLYGVETFNDSGKFNTALDTGDTFQVAVGVNRPDGTSTGEVQTLSYDELELLKSEVEDDPSKTIINVSGDKEEINAQLKQWIDFNTQKANAPEYDIFGGISPDYAIYKQPVLADAFKDGDPTAGQMKDAMLPQQVYAGNIPEGQFYGGADHISGQGPGLNSTQKISWISLAPQEIKAVQVDLMQAGYITAEDFFLEQGAWQGKTQEGMYSAMVDANLNMIDIYSQLNSEKERYFKKPPLAPKVYATPSPGFIKGEIDSALKAAGVTRKLTDAELIAFSDFYIQADKDYETATSEYSKNLDLANRLFPGAPDSISIPGTPSEELAAFAEQKFEPELAAQQRGIQERNDLSYLFSSLDQFDNMIGG
jgi:hypothetical protein